MVHFGMTGWRDSHGLLDINLFDIGSAAGTAVPKDYCAQVAYFKTKYVQRSFNVMHRYLSWLPTFCNSRRTRKSSVLSAFCVLDLLIVSRASRFSFFRSPVVALMSPSGDVVLSRS
jgi:hypothetical protein